MLESAWLFVGVLGAISSGISVMAQEDEDELAMVFGTIGFVSWAIWSYGSLTVEVVGDGSVFEFAMPSLTFLGIAMALLPGYIALTGPIELIERHKSGDLDDL